MLLCSTLTSNGHEKRKMLWPNFVDPKLFSHFLKLSVKHWPHLTVKSCVNLLYKSSVLHFFRGLWAWNWPDSNQIQYQPPQRAKNHEVHWDISNFTQAEIIRPGNTLTTSNSFGRKKKPLSEKNYYSLRMFTFAKITPVLLIGHQAHFSVNSLNIYVLCLPWNGFTSFLCSFVAYHFVERIRYAPPN